MNIAYDPALRGREATPEETKIAYSDYYFYSQNPVTPEWKEKNPFQFCGVCGLELVDRGRVKQYNRITGEKIITRYVECPTMDDATHAYFGPESDHDQWTLTLKKDIPF